MRISHGCAYPRRALLEIAQPGGQGPIRIEEIARRQEIPKKFLANLLVQLKRGRFVQSKKGPEGGYYLALSARQIKIGDVVRFVDGPIAPIQCVSRTLGEPCEIAGPFSYFPLCNRAPHPLA